MLLRCTARLWHANSCLRGVVGWLVTGLWVCRACDPEEARATFKMLKSSHIADASAHLFVEWARLESAAGLYPCMAGI